MRNALLRTPAAGLTIEPVGQHDPGHAGGFNQGAGIEQKKFPTNPWNFILAIEGAIVWSSGVARRHGVSTAGFLASPFTVRPRAVGYASSSEGEQATGRAEIWTPLWDRPVNYRELRAFISEGRADVGNRPAADAIGFASAASSLGVDRGISSFNRVMDAERLSVEGSSFDAALTLCPEDVAAFLDGDVDNALLEDLIFGFLCIDWRRGASREGIAKLRSHWSRPLSDRPVSRPWALLKLLFSASTLPTPTGEQLSLRSEPAIVALLCAGRVGEACRIAQRRLFVSGLNPLRVGFSDSSDGTRLAAALLFPVQITRLLRWSLAETGGEDVRTT